MAKGKSKHYFDYSLVFATIFLTVFGLVMIYSASSYVAQATKHQANYYMIRQAIFAFVGLFVMLVVSMMDYHGIMKLAAPLYVISIILMVYATIIGRASHGSRRWILIGGISFQPVEFVKLAMILFLSLYVVNLGNAINTKNGIKKILLMTVPIAALVGYNNLSSGIIILAIAFIITFIATKKRMIFVLIGAIAMLVLFFVEPIAKFLKKTGILKGYQFSRIEAWLDPVNHTSTGGYQVLQGLYAIGSGGILGKGLGQSIQKMYVPEVQNDMIFSIICEELGLFGAVSLIMMFLFIIYRCIRIANSAPDLYGSFIVIGVMAHIAIQVMLNIAVVTNMIPSTGITLPFISYGGTSLVFLMAEMGLVLSVSRSIRME